MLGQQATVIPTFVHFNLCTYLQNLIYTYVGDWQPNSNLPDRLGAQR